MACTITIAETGRAWWRKCPPFLLQLAHILHRQDKPRIWVCNGPAVLVCTHDILMKQGRLYGDRTLPLVMGPQESLDIDTPFDLELVACLLGRRG
ncbi:hypothetical protein DFAR_150015 [Desulfarculales bacterium]